MEDKQKLEAGTKIYVPKQEFTFHEDLVEVCTVFEDQDEGLLILDAKGFIKVVSRSLAFLQIEDAKKAYVAWLENIVSFLHTNWFDKPKGE